MAKKKKPPEFRATIKFVPEDTFCATTTASMLLYPLLKEYRKHAKGLVLNYDEEYWAKFDLMLKAFAWFAQGQCFLEKETETHLENIKFFTDEFTSFWF